MNNVKTLVMMAAVMSAVGVGNIFQATPGALNLMNAQEAQTNQEAQNGQRNTGNRGGIVASQLAARAGFGRSNEPKSPRGRGPGWTNAHAKRVARKSRNVKRHRAVMRRSK